MTSLSHIGTLIQLHCTEKDRPPPAKACPDVLDVALCLGGLTSYMIPQWVLQSILSHENDYLCGSHLWIYRKNYN